MKKFIFIFILLVASGVYATNTIKLKHVDQQGRDGVAINCKYCHLIAGISKEKGTVNGRGANYFCSGCHKD